MATSRSKASVSRRTALASLGAGGLAVATTARRAAAQEATPTATAGHPLVGTWMIDRDLRTIAEVPVVVVFTADGSFIDPGQGVAGVWGATGPTSAAMTIIPFVEGGAGGYAVVRATWEIDSSGDTMTGAAYITVVAPHGDVLATDELRSVARRLKVDSVENAGKELASFPTWTPTKPESTPEA